MVKVCRCLILPSPFVSVALGQELLSPFIQETSDSMADGFHMKYSSNLQVVCVIIQGKELYVNHYSKGKHNKSHACNRR